MQSHRETGVFPGQLDRLLKSLARNHKAGAGKNPVPVGKDNGIVNFL
jgi:hypothetical protein